MMGVGVSQTREGTRVLVLILPSPYRILIDDS
jgi:hypothetical protein